MNAFRTSNITEYPVNVNFIDLATETGVGISLVSGTYYINHIDLTTVTVTSSIALTGTTTSIGDAAFDGTNWWFLEVRGSAPQPVYLSCANFGSGTITHRTLMPQNYGSGTIKLDTDIIIAFVGYTASTCIYKYDYTGTLISTTNIPSLGTVSKFVLGNGYFWIPASSGNFIARVDTLGNVTNVSVPVGASKIYPEDFAGNNLIVLGNNTDCYGTINTSGTTYVSSGLSNSVNWKGTPPASGLTSTPSGTHAFLVLDSDNWITGVGPTRVNKVWGRQDVVPIGVGNSFPGSNIAQLSSGDYFIYSSGKTWKLTTISTDNNPITPTPVWQETANTTVQFGFSYTYYTSIHNFQFTANASDSFNFTVDSAVDPNAAFTGFSVSAAPYISVHDSTENRIAQTTSKTLSFTAPSTGSYTVRVQINPGTNSSAGTFKLGYILVVPPPVASFTYTPNPQLVGSNVSFTDTSTGSPTSWLWNFGDATTSTLQNPTHAYATPGNKTITLTVTNSGGSDSVPHTETIYGVLTIDNFTLPNECNDTTYPSHTFTATGGAPPYSWAWGAAGGPEPPFPVGPSNTLSFNNATQVMSGFASTGSPIDENFVLRLNLNSGDGQSTLKDFPYTIYAAPIIATTTLPDGTASTAYSQTLLYSGAGAAVDTWTIVSGSLPGGLTLHASTGVIDGTIDPVSGPFPFTVRGTSTNGCYDEQALSINVNATALHITTSSLANACRNAAYSDTLAAADGTPPYTWTLFSGTFPDFLSLNNSTGEISGTVDAGAAVQVYNFTIQVTDSALNTANKPLSIEVIQEPIWVTTSPLANGSVGVAYSQFVVATGAATYGFTGGTPPPGLNISVPTGEIFGTPTTVGTYTFTVGAYTVDGCLSERPFSITIITAPPVLTGSFSNTCLGSSVSNNSITVSSGGLAPFNFAITGGALPQQLVLDSTTGAVYGITSQAGNFNFDVTVLDATNQTDTATFSFTVYDTPVIGNYLIQPNIFGRPFSHTFTVSGGTGPYTWQLDGVLPAGLAFNSFYGTISGTPVEAKSSIIRITVTDTNGCSSNREAFVIITGPPEVIQDSLPPACQNQEYGVNPPVSILVFGGTPPYYYFIVSDTFPPQDLVLNPYTGQLSGIPLLPGTYPFTVKIVDQNNLYITKDYSLIVRTEKECGQPDEGKTVTVTKVRLSSLESTPVIVQDPFHQKHLHEYLPPSFDLNK